MYISGLHVFSWIINLSLQETESESISYTIYVRKKAAKSRSVIFLGAKMLSDVSFTVWVFLNVFSNFPDTVSWVVWQPVQACKTLLSYSDTFYKSDMHAL